MVAIMKVYEAGLNVLMLKLQTVNTIIQWEYYTDRHNL